MIDGSGIANPSQALGLQVKADNSTVKGLVIQNFGGVGVILAGSNNRLEGSFVGIDATGTAAKPNGLGVAVFGGNATIDGESATQRNVISGNTAGVAIASLELGVATLVAPVAGSSAQNNLIGTDMTGTGDQGNTFVGVAVIGSGNTVGGLASAEANTIAFNGQTGAGALVAGLEPSPGSPITLTSTGNAILGNAIYANKAVGIGLLNVPKSAIVPLIDTSTSDLPATVTKLLADLKVGVEPNVHLRTVLGPNNFLNTPVLTTTFTTNGVTTVAGTLDASPNTSYTVQIFSDTQVDASGHGQGRILVGQTTVTTGADGLASFRVTTTTAVPVGQFLAATATDPGRNTSPFSRALGVTSTEITAAPVPVATPTPATPSTSPDKSSPHKTPSTSRRPSAVAVSPATPDDPTTNLGTIPHGRKSPVALIGTTTNVVKARHGIVEITGHGRVAKIGKITAASTMDSKKQTPLLSTPWLLHIDMVISSPKGDLNVRISPGTICLNPFSQPVHLQYAVRGGTGIYKKAVGTGLVDLRLDQNIPKTADKLKAMGNQPKITGIGFSLEFRPGKLKKFGDYSQMWYKVIQTTVKKKDVVHKHKPA